MNRLLCLVVLLLVASCSRDTHEQPAPQITVHHRVIALAPSITELMYASGAGQYLVGAVEYSDYPQAAKALPRVGDALRVDTERVLALKPDLILIWPSGTSPSVIEQIKSLGVEVREIDAQRLAEIAKAMRIIGSLTGTEVTADANALQFEQQVEHLREQYRGNKRASIFIEVNREPLYTVNGNQIISEIVELCGGNNVFKELNQLAATVSVEAVVAKNPEIIITTDGTIEQLQSQWRPWTQLHAVKYKRLFSIKPDTINRAAPRVIDGIKEVCSVLGDKS